MLFDSRQLRSVAFLASPRNRFGMTSTGKVVASGEKGFFSSISSVREGLSRRFVNPFAVAPISSCSSLLAMQRSGCLE